MSPTQHGSGQMTDREFANLQLQREEALRNRDSKNATILTNKINRELAARKLAASSSDVKTIKVPPATGRRLIEALDDPNGRFYVRSGMSGAVLRQEGLAQTRSEGGWELTPKGRQWAETHKVNPGKSVAPGKSGGLEADRDRVAEAVKKVEFREHGWAHLDRIRAELGDMPRDRQDAAIAKLALEPGASLIPEVNQKALTPSQRASAIRLGGEEKHMLQLRKEHPSRATPKSASSKRDGGTVRDVTEQRAAEAQWARLSTLVAKQQGVAGPPDAGVVTVHFPNHNRASGFYDQMVSAFLDVERPGDPIMGRTIKVRNPKR